MCQCVVSGDLVYLIRCRPVQFSQKDGQPWCVFKIEVDDRCSCCYDCCCWCCCWYSLTSALSFFSLNFVVVVADDDDALLSFSLSLSQTHFARSVSFCFVFCYSFFYVFSFLFSFLFYICIIACIQRASIEKYTYVLVFCSYLSRLSFFFFFFLLASLSSPPLSIYL